MDELYEAGMTGKADGWNPINANLVRSNVESMLNNYNSIDVIVNYIIRVYRSGFDEGHKQGYNSGWIAGYDIAKEIR